MKRGREEGMKEEGRKEEVKGERDEVKGGS